jgi:hypothetical protein
MSSHLQRSINSRTVVQVIPGINLRPYSKITEVKRAGGVAQEIEIGVCSRPV